MNLLKILSCLALTIVILGSDVIAAETDLNQAFRAPPAAARPWVYWWWLNSNVTRDGITRDLEAMHRQGIQGVLIFNAGGGDSPSGPKFMSPEWMELFKFALSEASRLHMEVSMSLCDGWDAGGPWIPPEAANKKLTWSETQISPRPLGEGQGVRAVHNLPIPPTIDNFYRDVAVVALREKGPRPIQPAEIRSSPSVSGYCAEENWPAVDCADGDPNTDWRTALAPTPDQPAWIDYTYSEPLTASAVYVAGAKGGGPNHCALQSSDDGQTFKTLFFFDVPAGQSVTKSFPETTAKTFRLVIQTAHAPDVRMAEMWLLRKGDRPIIRPGIKWWQFKSANRSFWDWPKEGPAVMEEEYPEDGTADCRSDDVIDLSSKMDKNGKLNWQAPEGRWTILRFGYTLEGQRTRCSSTVIGYEADMLDPAGIETHFKHCAEPLLDAAGDLKGKTLKYLHVDSYELGADIRGQQPNWSAAFREEFRKRRGYDLLPYLPAMARRIVDDRQKTDRFLWDVRMTIADLFAEKFFGRFAELAHARGVGIHCETGYGTYPHPQFDGLRVAGLCDVTMGEFWWGTDIMSQFDPYCNVIRSVASPAHIYGRKIVQAESFTSWQHFTEYPAALKSLGDRAFCDGLNRMVFHQYTHQPTQDAPGYQYGAGTHIDRHVTWWKMAQPWLTYLTRCQYLLQNGRFHADACYFYGEGSAKYVPGKKHLNPPLPPGYNFDCVNADVLLNRIAVKDGRLVLPDGVSYRLLVLPTQRTMTPAMLLWIRQLIEAGATVLGDKPLHAPGLTGWPNCDAELKTLADAMWGNTDNTPSSLAPGDSPGAKSRGHKQIGKGHLFWQLTPAQVFDKLNLPPDFDAAKDNRGFEFIHRRLGAADVYFVSNQLDQTQKVDCRFRVAGRQPEVWDPVAGTIRALPEYRPDDAGRTAVPVTFEPNQSLFVVFRRPAEGAKSPAGSTNFPEFQRIAEIAAPWTVTFDPKWGGPEKTTFDKLVDWTSRPEEGIKYYSGTAVYQNRFDFPGLNVQDKKRCFLNLGKVNYLARVRLNGKDLGVLWTAPWRVDVTSIVKEKDNDLEIAVVNTWVNRLIGDARLPPEKRIAKTNVQYPPNHPPMPSGLLGPVCLEQE